jgi:hypothetical protein
MMSALRRKVYGFYALYVRHEATVLLRERFHLQQRIS